MGSVSDNSFVYLKKCLYEILNHKVNPSIFDCVENGKNQLNVENFFSDIT